MLKQIFNSLLRLWKKPTTTKLVVVGLHYSAHQFIEAAHKTQQFEVLAVVNNEPWLHKTSMLGARVIYAVELAAFINKFNINAVIDFADSKHQLDADMLNQINNTKYLLLSANDSVADILDQLTH